jgi:hypothetical protein
LPKRSFFTFTAGGFGCVVLEETPVGTTRSVPTRAASPTTVDVREMFICPVKPSSAALDHYECLNARVQAMFRSP